MIDVTLFLSLHLRMYRFIAVIFSNTFKSNHPIGVTYAWHSTKIMFISKLIDKKFFLLIYHLFIFYIPTYEFCLIKNFFFQITNIILLHLTTELTLSWPGNRTSVAWYFSPTSCRLSHVTLMTTRPNPHCT